MRRGMIFLFGGEPFDKLKALSEVEGRPPNKKGSFISKHVLSVPRIAIKGSLEFIAEGRDFMMRSSSPDRIIRKFSQRPLRLHGEPGFRRSTFE